MLLDPEDPAKILRRTAASIFEPSADFERQGFVPDVVFPTGIVATGNSFLVYYGAADCGTAVVEFSVDELLRGSNDNSPRGCVILLDRSRSNGSRVRIVQRGKQSASYSTTSRWSLA